MRKPRVLIDYDEKTGRFIIACPAWDTARAKAIPSRRWHKPTLTWRAPAVRMNAEYLLKAYADSAWSKQARSIAAKIAAPPEFRDLSRQWPDWYTFKTKPFGHQAAGLRFVYPLDFYALFMEMGTGKTKIVIDCAAAHFIERRINALMVVCPSSIRRNWLKELKVHCPILYRARVLDLPMNKGQARALQEWLDNPPDENTMDVFIVGVESLSQGSGAKWAMEFMRKRRAKMAVDESQRIKNPSAGRTKEAINLGREARIRAIMSGTPTPQGPMDLYSQFDFLSPDVFGIGDWFSFRNRYCIMAGYGGKEIVGYQNLEELTARIKPVTYQVKKEDVLDLLPKVYLRREVKMSKEQERLSREIKKGECFVGDIEVQVRNCLERTLRLQQVMSGFVSYQETDPVTGKTVTREKPIPGGTPMLAELMDALEEIPEGAQAIIWCKFLFEIDQITEALRKRFPGDGVVQFDGRMPDDKRWAEKEKFDRGEARWFVGNPACGGLGLDLISSEYTFYYSNDYNYETRAQSEDRNHRSGQKGQVKYTDMVIENSVGETILAALAAKKDLADYIREKIEAGEIDDLNLT